MRGVDPWTGDVRVTYCDGNATKLEARMSTELPIDPDLFHILVCPVAKKPLKWVGGILLSTDAATRRSYRIDNGIPIMLPDEGQVLDEAEWQRLMALDGPIGGGVEALSDV